MKVDKLDSEIGAMVLTERDRQHKIWGNQKHTYRQWWWILQEELAEARSKMELGYGIGEVKNELIQCSAVIQAWLRNIIINYEEGKGEEAFRKEEDSE